MNIDEIPAGEDIPNIINVIIEISANSDPIKYEFDKKSGALFVDRFIATGMQYPCNYGFIPHTLADDGDPVDVLVITPFPLLSGSVIACRPLGLLNMSDESGNDAKLIAVPIDKVCLMTVPIKTLNDIPMHLKNQIKHFFEQYKVLEHGKWVKVQNWEDLSAAHEEIINSIERYKRDQIINIAASYNLDS